MIVSLCNLQKKHRGEVTFPNLKSILHVKFYTGTYALLYPKYCYELENIFLFSLTGMFQKDSRNNLVLSVSQYLRQQELNITLYTSKFVKTTNLRISYNVVLKKTIFLYFLCLSK